MGEPARGQRLRAEDAGAGPGSEHVAVAEFTVHHRVGAERFHRDLDLHQALVSIARHEDSRMCLVLLGAILDNPGLAERLLQVLKPPAERSRRNDVD